MTLNPVTKDIKALSDLQGEAEYMGKSNMSSGNLYMITFTRGDKKIQMEFNDNHLNKAELNDWLYALWADAHAGDGTFDLKGFMREFGYEDIDEAEEIFEACNTQYEKFCFLFNREEQEAIEFWMNENM